MIQDDEKLVVLEQDKDKLLNHNYDGIRELDYPLPAWWSATFILCIIFSAVYYVYYTFLGGPSLLQVYKDQVGQTKTALAQTSGSGPEGGFSEDKLRAVANADGLKKGEALYTSYCVACHAEAGKGNIGPNLADNFWLHGKGASADIYAVIANGVPAKGMPAWESVIGQEAVLQVLAYVVSLKGSKLPGAKAPEGVEIK